MRVVVSNESRSALRAALALRARSPGLSELVDLDALLRHMFQIQRLVPGPNERQTTRKHCFNRPSPSPTVQRPPPKYIKPNTTRVSLQYLQ